ncbi:hypothetical protein [Pseudochryseolinea flava]|uniref:Uncharacterized protein n=1 Tax=Pseudochryseolinea flava TaxID=2059302 RepID=A0A364Y6M1_9BACT|nr:hypothetical protein [Pseudochryseolinea flava]RAW02543.1 hypothetical protein DQQ10_00025 [Pseudochryseolinea flava]
MKNNFALDLDHPNRRRVEFFLNNVDVKLEQVLFGANELKRSDAIVQGFKFKGTDNMIAITVIFAASYDDANEIGEANAFDEKPNTKWTVNGDVLFVVESIDADRRDEMLSHFAGRE